MSLRKVSLYLIATIMVLLSSCRDDLDIQSYVKFFNKKDNGLSNSIKIDSNIYDISIKSREYMALMNIGPDALYLSKEELKKQIDETEDYSYIFFKIKNDGKIIKHDSVQKINQINYFQSEVLNDVYLLNDDVKIHPCISTYISSNSMFNEHMLILAFPISFNQLESNPLFVINKSNYFIKNISIPLNIKNKSTLPQLAL